VSLSQPARDDARRNGGIGCAPVIGAVAVSLGAYAMGGTAKGWDAVAYWGMVAFVVTGLIIWAVVQFKHWIEGEKDCNKNDAITTEIDNAYYIDDQNNLHHGRLWVNKPDGLYVRTGRTEKLHRRWTPVELEQQRLVNASNWDGYNAAWNDSTMNEGTGQ
jgi:hypothetical protein